MPPEEMLNLLWALVETLAEADTTYETGMGDTECVFCHGDPGYEFDDYKHQDNCPVMIATKLMKERNTL